VIAQFGPPSKKKKQDDNNEEATNSSTGNQKASLVWESRDKDSNVSRACHNK